MFFNLYSTTSITGHLNLAKSQNVKPKLPSYKMPDWP